MEAGAHLVGRDHEWSVLERLLRVGGDLALVLGEGGMGKTTLVTALGASARANGGVVLRGAGDPLERRTLGLWTGVLRALDLPQPGSDPTVPDEERRWETLEVLASALRASSRRVLVIAEDLHWVDDDSMWVLDHLAGEIAGTTTVIAATSRPVPDGDRPRWDAVRRRSTLVPLGALGRDAAAQLVGSFTADRPDIDILLSRTGGNPLLIRELVLSGTAGPAPSGVWTLLAPSLDRLPPESAGTVASLSLAGSEAPLDVVAAGAGVDPETATRHLDDATRYGVVVADLSSRSGFRPSHELFAEAATRRLDPAARRAVHVRLADGWDAFATDAPSQAAAARQRLAAVPDLPATNAGRAALDAAASLTQRRDHVAAADLCAAAASVLTDHSPAEAELIALLRLAQGEALWAIDDHVAAEATCSDAARLARAASAPAALVVRAEVAARRHHNAMIPDPAGVAVLDALDASAAELDPALQVRLLGRRAVFHATIPELVDAGAELGERAVDLARATGDAELLVGALTDRFLTLSTPSDLRGQHAAAGEVIELASRAGRTDLALVGHQWRALGALRTGDLHAAIDAFSEMEALAALMPSPLWRFTAASRRALVLALSGDLDGALALMDAAAVLGREVLDDSEVEGTEAGLRFSALQVYGRPVGEREAGLHRRSEAQFGRASSVLVDTRLAGGDLALGDEETARRRLLPWVGRPDVARRSFQGFITLSVLAEAVIDLRWTEHVAGLRSELAAFSGMVPVDNGVGVYVPVDVTLGGLALVDGDVPAAVRHTNDALGLARSMPSPLFEAHALALLAAAQERAGDQMAAGAALDAAEAVAAPIGVRLDPQRWTGGSRTGGSGGEPALGGTIPSGTAGGPPIERLQATHEVGARDASLTADAGRWRLATPHGSADVADSTGMRQLGLLLTRPGTPVEATELAMIGGRPSAEAIGSDLGPMLDAQAKREYRRRIAELQSEIDEAEDFHDPARVEKSRLELDALLDELRRAVGIGGRDRPQASGAERARVNTTRNLRRAIAAISAQLPDLGAHLSVSVRTGHSCVYDPEPSALLTWTVSTSPVPDV